MRWLRSALAFDCARTGTSVQHTEKGSEGGEATHRPQVLEEVQARAAEQVVLALLLVGRVEYWSQKVVLDEEAVVEVVVAGDARAEEAQGGEAEVGVPGEARARADDARDGLGELGRRQDEVLGAEGVVDDEEAQEVAEMGEEGDVGGREGERRICEGEPSAWVRAACERGRGTHRTANGRAA